MRLGLLLNGDVIIGTTLDYAGLPVLDIQDPSSLVLGADRYINDQIIKGDMPPRMRIELLKRQLSATDYEALKFAEGRLTAEEYKPISEQRQSWRDEINALEAILEVE